MPRQSSPSFTVNDEVVDLLYECKTGNAVEDVFRSSNIDDDEERMKYLRHCLGNPKVFFSGPKKDDEGKELHSQYVTLRSMFVTGSWRELI